MWSNYHEIQSQNKNTANTNKSWEHYPKGEN